MPARCRKKAEMVSFFFLFFFAFFLSFFSLCRASVAVWKEKKKSKGFSLSIHTEEESREEGGRGNL